MDLTILGGQLQQVIDSHVSTKTKQLTIKLEPGRFTVAECGILLGQVNAVKKNGIRSYAGTDLGFNVLIRPAMYDAYHDIEVYSLTPRLPSSPEPVTIVGNICETGDIIAKDRSLPGIEKGDVLGIMDAGAYGMVMSSNYNCRLRPAEVLIDKNGTDVLIRKREELEDLIRQFPNI